MGKGLIWIATALAVAILCKISVAQSPLLIPSTLSGTTFNLNIKNDTTEFYPGIKTPTYGINGPLLAPTLILNKWDWVTMNVTNNLTGFGNSTTIHWHGLHLPPEDDGGPHQIIAQNSTWSPSFQVLNTAGTFWYHPHGEGKTDLHVSKGLAGMIIIKDSAEAAINLPRTYGVDDIPIILQTKSFDELNQIAISTGFDTVPMVNGVINPYVDLPSQVVRFRLLNGSSGRSFLLGFSNNMNFHLIATDGGLIETPVEMNRIQIANGERAEILVDFSALQNDTLFLMNYGSELPKGIMGADSVGDANNMVHDYYENFLNGADFNLLQLHVGNQTSNPVTGIPTSLVSLSPWNSSSATVNRRLELDTLSEMFTIPNLAEGPFGINGTFFDMENHNEVVLLNTTEIWTLYNKTMVAHPFHIHDVQFYLLDINGGPVPDYQKGQKDVVLVMPGDSVRFITKFEHFTNDSVPYMYHCHLLHHEDDGMMGSFLVKNPTGVKEQKIENHLILFPNPTNERVYIRIKNTENPDSEIKIYDSLGRIVFETNITSSELSFNTEIWQNGLYSLIYRNNKRIETYKFIVY